VRAEDKIRSALSQIGQQDVLKWAAEHPTLSLVDLNRLLGAGVAPVALENYMREVALDAGTFNEFVQMEAVRRLNEHLPNGLQYAKNPDFGFASGWAMWASLFEASHRNTAMQVWRSLSDTLRNHPEWCPRDMSDPLVQSAFAGCSFQPSEGATKLAAAVRRMEGEMERDNQPYSLARALSNLRRLPPGYGYLHGLYVVDGQVCNGGFLQLYENEYGPSVPLAVDGFRAVGREDLAVLVEESLLYAQKKYARLINRVILSFRLAAKQQTPRPFEQLDEEYYRLTREPDWMEIAMTNLVVSRPDLF
jgi:hypothetical protein